MSDPKFKIGIVGGGISGLSAAYHLARQLGPNAQITLWDASDRLGGVLETLSIDGYTVETSADMFTIDPPHALDLCQQLGLSDQLISAKPTPDRAYIAAENGIHPVPRGFSLMLPSDVDAVLQSDLLSDAGKQRFMQEQDIPPRTDEGDESLRDFAVRRFGNEVFERLIQPLASGIYTADPRTLSMQATMDRFLKLEAQYGSLIVAAKQQAADTQSDRDNQTSGARYGLFRAPVSGIGQLVQALESQLDNVEIRRETPVMSIRRADQWQVQASDGEVTSVDRLLLATPAAVTGELLRDVRAAPIEQLKSISAASTAIVVLAIDQRDLERADFGGYGIIVPDVLGLEAIACSFTSNKFDQRAPQGKLLVRCFFGGALRPEMADQPEETLVDASCRMLQRLLGFAGQPDWTQVFRWPNCMPQYTHGHRERVRSIDRQIAQIEGLELAGNSYHGVGIPACIASGRSAADRLMKS